MDCQVMAMTVIQDRRPQHRLGAERLAGALLTAVRSLRTVQDEQTRMWDAFYRVAPSAPAPRPPAGKLEHAGPETR